jgi:hypothetical protein
MQSLKSLKRDITSVFVISAIVIAMALAWGSPFVGPRAAHADEATPQIQQQQQTLQAKAKPHPGVAGYVQMR